MKKHTLFGLRINSFISAFSCLWVVIACQRMQSNKLPAVDESTKSSPPSLILTDEATSETETHLSVEEWKSRWLKGIPCLPPCWEEITPGVTTRANVTPMFVSKPQFELVDKKANPLQFYWNTLNKSKETLTGYGEILFEDSSLDSIVQSITVKYPLRIALGEVIYSFGEPSHVMAQTVFESETHYWDIYFIWIDKGFLVKSGGISNELPVINGELETRGAWYFTPGLEEFINAGILVPISAEFLTPWKGYGAFLNYVPQK